MMRAAFPHHLEQTRAAEPYPQAHGDAPDACAPAQTRDDHLRSITGLLRRMSKTRAGYHDPLFERPDLIEDDYYRFRNQARRHAD